MVASTAKKSAPSEKPKTIDFRIFQPKVDSLCKNMIHKIEREWPKEQAHLLMAQGFFLVTLKVAHNTFETVCYLCADKRLKQHDWKWRYVLVLPTLNRTILDSVFSVVFMLEDLPGRSQWFHESGWREVRREVDEQRKEYGSDPEWSEWLDKMEKMLQEAVKLFNIPPDKVANPASIKWWPNPGKMPSYGVSPPLPPDRQFMKYLNDWFYREMSSHSHLSFHAMMKTGYLALFDLYDADTRESIRQRGFPFFRAQQVIRTVTLLLALLSEVEKYFNFGLAPELLDLWDFITRVQPEAKEIYDKRYGDFWPDFLLREGERRS